jgi:DNA-binding response OmpR family regulator
MRIAILEEDSARSDRLRWVLESVNHACFCFTALKKFQSTLSTAEFDLVILDWTLLGHQGPKIVREIRNCLNSSLPILCIVSQSDEDNLAAALEAGANDFVLKPVRRGDLVIRVNTLLRSAYPEQTAPEVFRIEGFEFHPKSSLIVHNQKLVNMTQKEFNLSLLLFRNLGKALSRAYIQETVWGHGTAMPSRTMDTHVSRVRSKLELHPENGFRLTPLYGFGYKLEKDAENDW